MSLFPQTTTNQDESPGSRITLKPDELPQYPKPAIAESYRNEITLWLKEAIPAALRRNVERNERNRQRWQMTLAGDNPDPPFRPDASNISVPLTLWAYAAVKARLRMGTTGSDNFITATPVKSRDAAGNDLNAVAKSLQTFLQAEFESPRALDGVSATNTAYDEAAANGWGGLKLTMLPDQVIDLPTWASAQTTRLTVKGRPRFQAIASADLITVDGFGSNTQRMPLAGHRSTMTWNEIQYAKAIGMYDDDAVTFVENFYTKNDQQTDRSAVHRPHEIAEVYFSYPTSDDSGGIPSPLVCFWHIDADVPLGFSYNYTPFGMKPIWILQFDQNPDSRLPEGVGVCAKLDGAQAETDTIHNLGIEAVKRVVANIIGLKASSGAETEFGGNKPIYPGDTYVTEDPSTDLVPQKLGDISGVEASQIQEQATRGYVTSLFGLDPAALGNVESGKRVPASLGLSITREGRTVIAHALSSGGLVLTESLYVLLEMYRYRLPEDTLNAALDPKAAELLKSAVFAATDADLRTQYILTFNAQDATAAQEARKQELLVVGQYLQAYYDRLIQYAQMAIQLPEPLRNAMLIVMQKHENATRALISTVESIQNADEVIASVTELTEAIQAAGSGGLNVQPGGAV